MQFATKKTELYQRVPEDDLKTHIKDEKAPPRPAEEEQSPGNEIRPVSTQLRINALVSNRRGRWGVDGIFKASAIC